MPRMDGGQGARGAGSPARGSSKSLAKTSGTTLEDICRDLALRRLPAFHVHLRLRFTGVLAVYPGCPARGPEVTASGRSPWAEGTSRRAGSAWRPPGSPEQDQGEPECEVVGAWRTNGVQMAGEETQEVGRRRTMGLLVPAEGSEGGGGLLPGVPGRGVTGPR